MHMSVAAAVAFTLDTNMTDCTHRQKRLVISFPEYVYEVQCSDCLLTGNAASSGWQAFINWLALLRAEARKMSVGAA